MPSAYKFALFVLTSVLSTTGIALFDGSPLTWHVAITLAISALTAVGVWAKANTVTQPWAKFLVGLIGAVVQIVASAWTDGHIDGFEVQAIVLAVLGFLSVGAVANPVVIPAGQA